MSDYSPPPEATIWTVGFYDPETGDIVDITQGPKGSIFRHAAPGRPFVFLPDNRQKWDLTHRVSVEADHSLVERA
jgi:hypothetical protein